MKTFAWHVLILGGFYFIVSLLSSFPQGAVADVASITILSIFFIMFIVLCFKKNMILSVVSKTNLPKRAIIWRHWVSANISALYLC